MRQAFAEVLPLNGQAAVEHAESSREDVRGAIKHAIHYLPTQGPISVFVHHNTLHSFDNLPFEQAVLEGGKLYRCEPYLSEDRYRQELSQGRILLEHLRQVMLDDLGDDADELIASFGTRFSMRLAMLQMTLHSASDAELSWLLAETDLLTRFREEVNPQRREHMIENTKRLVLRNLGLSAAGQGELWDDSNLLLDIAGPLIDEMGRAGIHKWTSTQWESCTLRLLWRICQAGVSQAELPVEDQTEPVRHRDKLLKATGEDSDALVNEILIRFCGAFLDQGFSGWSLPGRERGFAVCFAELYLHRICILPTWMDGLQTELAEIVKDGWDPLDSINHSLELLGVEADAREETVCQTLLALRGWAGMLWQMESTVPWLPHPAPAGSLDQYLAIRLILERFAIGHIGQQWLGTTQPQAIWNRAAEQLAIRSSNSIGQMTYTVFQLAQACGWMPRQLLGMSPEQWTCLTQEILAFPSVQRRRILHLGYERRYRNASLDALKIHSRRRYEAVAKKPKKKPAFHVSFCIDDREESFRRHLEEIDPECETSSAAGFYAVAMYYRGADQALYRPLCPNIITPEHYVCEEPVFSSVGINDKRAQLRRRLGQLTHQVHSGSRTMVGGLLTGVFGAVATIPLVARILAPHLTSKIRNSFGALVRPPTTELRLERLAPEPGPEPDAQGYSLNEMSAIVCRILQDIGLTQDMPTIVLMVGHGSSSLNNPHESAYSCGACSGGRGGPNARAFAVMANDPRVRSLVAERGVVIPDDVRFVGAYHNTCTDLVEYYDLDLLPRTHRQLFRRMERSINEARARNAHERSRRFHMTPLDMTPREALESVEQRAEDLSQARPEYNHATNALVVVARREWTRGLFMDRRVFLTSYDPQIDDEQNTVLTRILAAAIPVCAGISLEYYFSTVDTEGYGCGSKLPHNVASMLGVMTGASSDLRPGLSQQMIEIHEPMRILFVVETTPEKMLSIIQANPGIASLGNGNWIQLAVMDFESNETQIYRHGRFEPYALESHDLPRVDSSIDWYRGHREHLGYASIGF